ncbi:hypothetical protein NPIL_31281 [Nephila pilipes]|uniref:Reverse transcriptase n=1 Tax=Nephila pilipes TaxID=299642 RepID=A0A8X6TL01_NEPPI|nr:hypothetical protein NPIL_31281 [Nephila pilipes]
MLEGREFVIFMHQEPLTYIFIKKKVRTELYHQIRHIESISENTTEIRCVPRGEYVVADTLLRIETLSMSRPIDYDSMAQDSEAYNPVVNGTVERLHKKLKAELRCQDSPRWSESVAKVFLGIKFSLKQDLPNRTTLYKGPYRAIARNSKFYTLKIRGGKVSTDRLKSAYILHKEARHIESNPVSKPEDKCPETRMRSGRHSRLVV